MKRWGDIVGATGTVLLSLLSCAVCPLCLPLYAGLLSIMGIELADMHEFFFPVMITFAFITLGCMIYQTYIHHGKWTPFTFALGSSAGMIIAAFKGYEYLLYLCLALFLGSILWNKRSLIHTEHGCC